MKIFKQGEAELQVEDDRKNKTITLTMDSVKGKVVYNANCVSCHNNDTKKQGNYDNSNDCYGLYTWDNSSNTENIIRHNNISYL